MPKAVVLNKPGSPENLKYQDVDVGVPSEGEVLVKHTAIGLNYVDTYHRSGLYPLPSYPAIVGVEACGKIEDVGKDVKELRVGDRVAYCTAPPGAYSERRIINEKYLVRVPDIISDNQAAAVMVKGLTAYYLLHRTFRVDKSHTILVHAAAGGVGQIMVQWAKFLGAKVIGTVGSDEKAKIAEGLGCHHVINYKTEKFVKKVMEITEGMGVNVVYDAVGKDTFLDSIESLAPLGMMVSYGQASGPVPQIDLLSLLGKKSLFFTRPSLFTYMAEREQLQIGANELFKQIKSNVIKINVSRVYPLEQASDAHRDIESRKTSGSVVMVP